MARYPFGMEGDVRLTFPIHSIDAFMKLAHLEEVLVHVGDKWSRMSIAVMKVGYFLNEVCTMRQWVGPVSSWSENAKGPLIHIAEIEIARHNDVFYQVIRVDGVAHLYLPSIVDETDAWK